MAATRTTNAQGARRAVLDSARGIFGRVGYGSVDIEAIAEQASVPARTVHEHFPDKEALFRDMIGESADYVSRALVDRSRACLERAASAQEALVEVGKAWVAVRQEFPAHFALVRQMESESRLLPESVRACWQARGPGVARGGLRDLMAKLAGLGWLAPGDPEYAADHFHALVLAPAAALLADDGPTALDDARTLVTAAVAIFLHGYAPSAVAGQGDRESERRVTDGGSRDAVSDPSGVAEALAVADSLSPAVGHPVREVEIVVAGVPLSGLLALPAEAPRALVVALHGGGMRAGYFDGQADPATSLLTLAAAGGYAALALDRPGYGASAKALPQGVGLTGQAAYVQAAVDIAMRRYAPDAGYLLLGHSLGAKLALCIAAAGDGQGRLLGVDACGVSDTWAVDPHTLTSADTRRTHHLHWGPPRLYPLGTFLKAASLVTPIPECEAAEIAHWPERFGTLAGAIDVPVRFTFAEYERWWRCDADVVEAMTVRLAAPRTRTDRLAGAGHNVSLGRAARGYHLRVLSFLEECLATADAGRRTAAAGRR
jgi:AcrR family transcriptional regulator